MSNIISETYNMNCLEFMKTLPDNHFNLSIVDPPYGISVEKMNFGSGKNNNFVDYADKNKSKTWDNQIPSDEYFAELFRVSVNQIIFGGNYFNLPPTRCFYFWYKGAGMKGRDYADGELIWTSFDRVARILEYNPLHGGKKTKIHPAQKAVSIYKTLLKDFAVVGDKIFDSHLGSQSSRIAAYDLGFDFVGCELDEDYFNSGNERFNRHISQGNLFEKEVVKPKQDGLF